MGRRSTARTSFHDPGQSRVSMSRTSSSMMSRLMSPKDFAHASRSAASSTDAQPLLAAPFHSVVAYEWDRYLP